MSSRFTKDPTTIKPWCRLHRGALLFLASGLAAVTGCGGDDLLLPQDGEPAGITIIRGDDQHGTVGEALTDSFVVAVRDPGGRPVSDVEVVFLLPPGAGVTPNDTVRTGSDGQAAVHYTLSTTSGEQEVRARAAGVPDANSTAVFTALADPASPESLRPDGGDGQSAQVSTVLPESLAVMAVDHYGNGVAGVEVTWDAEDGGDVSPRTATTGPDGRAATARTLGDNPGTYGASARADDLQGSPVSFSATAIAAPRPQLVLLIQPSSTARAGLPLAEQPVLQLQDPQGAPLNQADVNVTVQVAEGEGSLGGKTTVKSDGNGRVTFSDLELRGETGSRTLIFAADGFTPVTSTQIVVQPGAPDAGESSISVPDGTAGSTTAITIRLKDEFGNPITGAAGSLSVAVAGANPSSGLTVTDQGEGRYSASYVPLRSGNDAVAIQFEGAPLAGSPFESRVVPGPASAAHTTADVVRTDGLFTRVDGLITVRDAQDNLLGRGGDLVQFQVNGGTVFIARDNGSGTYSFAFTTIGVQLSIAITLNGAPIQGSPFTPRVR